MVRQVQCHGPIVVSDLRKTFNVLSEHKDDISIPPAMLETMKRSYGMQSYFNLFRIGLKN